MGSEKGIVRMFSSLWRFRVCGVGIRGFRASSVGFRGLGVLSGPGLGFICLE